MGGRLVKGTCQSLTPVSDSTQTALMRAGKESVQLVCDRGSLERLGRAAQLVGPRWRPLGPNRPVDGQPDSQS